MVINKCIAWKSTPVYIGLAIEVKLLLTTCVLEKPLPFLRYTIRHTVTAQTTENKNTSNPVTPTTTNNKIGSPSFNNSGAAAWAAEAARGTIVLSFTMGSVCVLCLVVDITTAEEVTVIRKVGRGVVAVMLLAINAVLEWWVVVLMSGVSGAVLVEKVAMGAVLSLSFEVAGSVVMSDCWMKAVEDDMSVWNCNGCSEQWMTHVVDLTEYDILLYLQTWYSKCVEKKMMK